MERPTTADSERPPEFLFWVLVFVLSWATVVPSYAFVVERNIAAESNSSWRCNSAPADVGDSQQQETAACPQCSNPGDAQHVSCMNDNCSAHCAALSWIHTPGFIDLGPFAEQQHPASPVTSFAAYTSRPELHPPR